jgi:hypothetical protein
MAEWSTRDALTHISEKIDKLLEAEAERPIFELDRKTNVIPSAGVLLPAVVTITGIATIPTCYINLRTEVIDGNRIRLRFELDSAIPSRWFEFAILGYR